MSVQQVRTTQASFETVMRDPDFLAGFQSRVRGEPFPRITPSWEWERGRLFAASMGGDAQRYVGRTRWRPTVWDELVHRFKTKFALGCVI